MPPRKPWLNVPLVQGAEVQVKTLNLPLVGVVPSGKCFLICSLHQSPSPMLIYGNFLICRYTLLGKEIWRMIVGSRVTSCLESLNTWVVLIVGLAIFLHFKGFQR